MLNLGGIANLTWLPSKQKNVPCLSTDTGPANTLINEAMEKYFKKPFDEGGVVAQSGKVHSGLVKYLLIEPFFTEEFPKTTGQEEFNLNLVEALMIGYGIALEPVDLVASLAELTVKSIVRALDVIAGSEAFELYVSGGGVYNSALMEGLKTGIEPSVVKPLHELGMPAEAKEAALMAFLANEMILGHQFSVRGKNITLGKISLPD